MAARSCLTNPSARCSRPRRECAFPMRIGLGKELRYGAGDTSADPRLVIAFSRSKPRYLGMSPFNCPSLFSISFVPRLQNRACSILARRSRVSELVAENSRKLGVKIQIGEAALESLDSFATGTGHRALAGCHHDTGRLLPAGPRSLPVQ